MRPRTGNRDCYTMAFGRVFCQLQRGAKDKGMSDRAFLFLFSIVMIVFGLAATVWLFVTGQAGTVDGLFLVLTALLVVAAFGLYVMYAVHRAMEAAAKPPAQPAKAGAAAPAAKRAPTPAAQA